MESPTFDDLAQNCRSFIGSMGVEEISQSSAQNVGLAGELIHSLQLPKHPSAVL